MTTVVYDSCGWESAGTYSPTIVGMSPSPVHRLTVSWPASKVSASALDALRRVSPCARSLSVAALSAMLFEGQPFELGDVAEHARIRVSTRLQNEGFVINVQAVP